MTNVQIRPLHDHEIPRFSELSYYAFDGRSAPERATDFGRRVTPERNILVAVDGDTIVSQVMFYEFGVWIGGVRYPTGGLANVATAPERTRHGYASQTLRAGLAWMRNELGQCLSTLYPTVYPLYAKLGWTLADASRTYTGPPSAFRPAPHLPVDPGGRVERRLARPEDVDLLEPLYRQFAAPRTGYLDRPRWYWDDMVLNTGRSGDPNWLALWFGSDGQLAAYTLYRLVRTGQSRLEVSEIIALRPEGYHGIFTFLAAHNLWDRIQLSAGDDVPWRSLVVNPHDLEVHVPARRHFMLRVVDVARAIALRPVPELPTADVVLQIRDEAAPWNDGHWRIGVRQEGSARRWGCELAPDLLPAASLDITTFSALFAGFLTVPQAIDVGYLRASPAAVETLANLLHTTYPPHSYDHF